MVAALPAHPMIGDPITPAVAAPTFEHHRRRSASARPPRACRGRRRPGPDGPRRPTSSGSWRGDEVWSGTPVATGESVLVPWPFAPLASRERRRGRVRRGGADGRLSAWSEPAAVEAGPARGIRLARALVGPDSEEDPGDELRPPLLRREFDVTRRRRAARAVRDRARPLRGRDQRRRASATTCSRPAGRATTTGCATRPSTSPTRSRPGANALGAMARRRLVPRPARLRRRPTQHLRRPTRAARPARDHATPTARTERVVTDDDLARARRARSSASDLYDGETLRRAPGAPRLVAPGLRRRRLGSRSRAVDARPGDPRRARRPAGAPHRGRRAGRRSRTRRSGRTIVDFGQNLVGRLRIRVRGPAGHDDHAAPRRGARGRRARAPARCASRAPTDATPCAAAAPRTWEPRFTFHGFRYAEIDGWPGDARRRRRRRRVVVPHRHGAHRLVRLLRPAAQPAARERRVGHARQLPRRPDRLPAARRAPRLDRRHPGLRPDRVASSTTAPACSRRGWATSPPSSATTAPCRWYVPSSRVHRRGRRSGPAAAWGDAAVDRPVGAVPALRRHRASCAAQYDSMRALGRPRRPRSPAPTGCGTPGFQFGDWLDPTAPPDDPADARTDPHLVATAYLARSAELLAGTAARARPTTTTPRATARWRPRSRAAFSARVRHADRPADQRRARRPTRWRSSSTCCPTPSSARAPATRLAELVARRRLPHRAPASSARRSICDALCRRRPHRRRLPPAAAARVPVVAVPGDDGRHHDLGALGQPAARTARSTPAR